MGDPAIEEAKEEESEQRDIEEGESLAAPEEEEEKGEIVSEEDVFPFDPEFLKDAPPEVRRAMIQMSSAMIRMGGPVSNPLAAAVARVLDADHLTSLIESMDRSAELEVTNAQRTRWTVLLCLIIVLVFAGFALWLLKDSNPDLLKDLVAIIASLVGGLGAGYGIKTWAERKRQ